MPNESIIARLDAAGILVRDEHAERRLKVLNSTSASQIERWSQCPRQWFGGYIMGDWAPQSEAQARGTAIDLEVQKHYRGEPVNKGWQEAVDGIVKLLPAGVVIQQKIVMPTYDGGPMLVGYPDFLYEAAPGDVFVDDLKSTSDFRYAKKPEQLRTHIQPVTYSAWLWTLPEVRRVRARHVTAKFQKDDKHPVGYRFRGARLTEAAEMERERIQAEWLGLHDGVRAMVATARTVANFDDLPALGAVDVDEFGKTGCERFGGCHFRARCGLDVLGGRKKMSGSSLTERLEAMRAAQAANGAGTPTATTLPIPQMEQPPSAPGYVATQPTMVIPGALTGSGYTVERVNPNNLHPAEVLPADAGYKRGQPCNGNGHYASSNGQGFIPVEAGHACTVCQPGRVLPPDAPPRTSTSAESDAAEERAKKRGRPKKEPEVFKIGCSTCGEKLPASEFEAHIKSHTTPAPAVATPQETDADHGYRVLQEKGFTLDEINLLNSEGLMTEALEGKVTTGMLRQPPLRAGAVPAPAAPIATATAQEQWYKNSGPPPATEQTPPPTTVTNVFVSSADHVMQAPVSNNGGPIFIDHNHARVESNARVQEHLKALRKAPPKVPPAAPTIYVDCHPVKGPHRTAAVDAADWLGPIAELAALAHVDRDSGKPMPLDDVFLAPFGTGRAVLAAALRETLDSCPAVLAIDSTSPGQQVALEVLRPHAAVIVEPKRGR